MRGYIALKDIQQAWRTGSETENIGRYHMASDRLAKDGQL